MDKICAKRGTLALSSFENKIDSFTWIKTGNFKQLGMIKLYNKLIFFITSSFKLQDTILRYGGLVVNNGANQI